MFLLKMDYMEMKPMITKKRTYVQSQEFKSVKDLPSKKELLPEKLLLCLPLPIILREIKLNKPKKSSTLETELQTTRKTTLMLKEKTLSSSPKEPSPINQSLTYIPLFLPHYA